jgi:hypothetical protein
MLFEASEPGLASAVRGCLVTGRHPEPRLVPEPQYSESAPRGLTRGQRIGARLLPVIANRPFRTFVARSALEGGSLHLYISGHAKNDYQALRRLA